MVKIVKFSCHGCHAPAYGCSLPGDNSGSYVLHSDYAALEARHAELREAVKAAKVDWECCILTGQSTAYDNLARLCGEE